MSKESIMKMEESGLEWIEIDLGNIEIQQFIPAVKRKNHKLEKEFMIHLMSYVMTMVIGVLLYALLYRFIWGTISYYIILRFFVIYTVTYLLCELSCLIYDVYKIL